MDALITSPGDTVIVSWTEFAGRSSYQAMYSTEPRDQSCSVPTYISDSSYWPPMPIQVAENVLDADGVTLGTTHEALTEVTTPAGDNRSEDTV